MEITLRLTAEEADFLTHILEERHKELLSEIHHAHHHDFKVVLRDREKLLESLLEKLSTVALA